MKPKQILIALLICITFISCNGVKESTGNEQADASIAANYLYEQEQENYVKFVGKCRLKKDDYYAHEVERRASNLYFFMVRDRK